MAKFEKGHVKKGGRPKGRTNKATANQRAVLEEAFRGIGGVKDLIEWGKENRTEFYKLWIKMLPTEIKTPDGEALLLKVLDLRGDATE